MIKKTIIVILNEFFIWFLGTPIYHPRFWEDERSKRKFINGYGYFKKIRTMLSGFNSDKYVLYNFAENDRTLYLNDIRRRILAERICKRHYYLVHDKIVFEKYFQSIVPIEPKLSLIRNGKFIGLNEKSKIVSIKDFISILKGGTELFLKPYDGGSGRGILMISYSDGVYLVNKKTTHESELIKLIEKLNGYIVEKRFIQRGYSNDIYPNTLNTLRVFTMVDPTNKNPFIAAAVHRFGTKESIYADNWSQGGLSVYIDPETGVMGKGIQYPFNGKLNFVDKHPDTGLQFEGIKIKEWDKVCDIVLKGADYVSFMPMLGWDVILNDGEVFVQEANYNPDINLLQVHQPLLADVRIAKFYKYHKVIL